MSVLVVSGAQYQCSGGAGPGVLMGTQGKVTAEAKPLLTIKDAAGFINIIPCPSCVCLTHPVIAPIVSLTGIVVPQPCTPQTTGMWLATETKLLTEGTPCLCSDSQIMCAIGGILSIAQPGQSKVIM